MASIRITMTIVMALVFILTSATTGLLVLLQQPIITLSAANSMEFRPQQTECIQPLLLDRIHVKAFTATSELGDATGARRYAAESMRSENADYAWCPSKRVGRELTEYVQVDMGELNAITKIVLSGLMGEGGGTRYTPHFTIRYKREADEKRWRTYRQLFPTQTSLLVGSTSALLPKFVVFDPPLIARWVRLYPYRDTPGLVCIRLAAYGCRFSDDLVEYQIPEGSLATPPYRAVPSSRIAVDGTTSSSPFVDRDGTRNQTRFFQAGAGLSFSDVCYDGYRVEPGSLLDGGLGCLADLTSAPHDATPTPLQTSLATRESTSPSHRFVGWHRGRWKGTSSIQHLQQKPHEKVELVGDDAVHMKFRFNSVRRFTRLQLHVSNNFPAGIRLPRRIEVRFSVNGRLFSKQPMITQDFLANNHTDGVMSLEMDLHSRIGRFVQLKAFFHSDWLLVSEIKFKSELTMAPFPEEDSSDPPKDVEPSGSVQNTEAQSAESDPKSPSNGAVSSIGEHKATMTMLSVIVSVMAFILLLSVVMMFVCWKTACRHVRFGKQSVLTSRPSASVFVSANATATNAVSGDRCYGDKSKGAMIQAPLLRSEGTVAGLQDILTKNLSCATVSPMVTTGHPTHPVNGYHNPTLPAWHDSGAKNRLFGTTGPSEHDMTETTDPFGRNLTHDGDHINNTGASALPQARRQSIWSRFCPATSNHSKPKSAKYTRKDIPTDEGSFTISKPELMPFSGEVYSHGYPTRSGVMYPGSYLTTVDSGTSVPLPYTANQAIMDQLWQTIANTAPQSTTPAFTNLPVGVSHPTGVTMDGLVCSGYSNSATNSTGASVGVGIMNPDVNLYAAVSGESDGDSNCTGTMAPEYASTNSQWINTLPYSPYEQHQSQCHQQQQQQLQQQQQSLFSQLPNTQFPHYPHALPTQNQQLHPQASLNRLPNPLLANQAQHDRTTAGPPAYWLVYSNQAVPEVTQYPGPALPTNPISMGQPSMGGGGGGGYITDVHSNQLTQAHLTTEPMRVKCQAFRDSCTIRNSPRAERSHKIGHGGAGTLPSPSSASTQSPILPHRANVCYGDIDGSLSGPWIRNPALLGDHTAYHCPPPIPTSPPPPLPT